MSRMTDKLSRLDMLSAGTIVGSFSMLSDALLRDLAPGIRLWHIRPSFFLGVLTLAMLATGKRAELESKHSDRSWVRFVLAFRWILILYWVLSVVFTVVAQVALYQLRRAIGG